MKKLIPIFLILSFASSLLGVEKKAIEDVNLNELLKEVQMTSTPSERQMNLVWLVPAEYWRVAFSKQGQVEDLALEEFTETFKPYFVVAVIQCDISLTGTFNFYTEQQVAKGLKVTSTNSEGKTAKLTPLESVGGDVAMLLEILKPILSSAMGNMGSNFHFFVFSDYSEHGGRNFDPYGKGTIDIGLVTSKEKEVSNTFETPFNALYTPRQCPNGKPAHISWNYCPWTGEKLPD